MVKSQRGFRYYREMTTEHRKAPRRAVLHINRVGEWGNVQYHHVLSCGHIEKRPRASRSPQIACAWCLRSDKKEQEMAALVSPRKIDLPEDSEMATIETEVMMAQASLASHLGVPLEAVDVVTKDDGGILRVRYATVFLTERDVRRITGLE